MMQLGFVSAILPELSLDEVLSIAGRVGYECVEVMCWPPGAADRRYAGVTHLDVTGFGASAASEVEELCARHQVAISGLGYYPNPLSPRADESSRAIEHLHQLIEAASTLGIPQVNTFVGRDWTRSVDDNWPRFLEVWQPLVAVAEKHQVRIGIENCPMLFTRDEWPGGKNLASSPALWKRMFEDIPSRSFGLNYDPSHLIWQHMDECDPLFDLADRLFHVHAKDVRVDLRRLNQVGILAHPNEYHSPKLPGLGQVDWARFFSTLGEVRYRGPVCVEVEDRAYEDSLTSRLRALEQSHTFLRNFIPRPSASAS